MNSQKINYYQKSLEEIKWIEKNFSKKPTLCMHVCCGPCSTFPLSFLCDVFQVTLYFNNSNIYPNEEYSRRLEELKTYLKEAQLDVQLIVTPYCNEEFTQKLAPFKDEPEQGKRCHLCYRMRMNEAYHYAHDQHFDYFTTVMTISRQKNSQVLNQIGEQLSSLYPNTKYFYSDFKKKDGNLKGIQIAQQYQLYRQEYCGCVYSIKEEE